MGKRAASDAKLAGVSARRLRLLRRFIHEEVENSPISGLSVAVVLNNGFLWHAHVGKCSAQEDSPKVMHSTKFEVASVSKTFIGVAALWLHEQGYLDIEKPINEYLPYEVRNPTHHDVDITVKQLIIHTSSICDNFYNEFDESEVYTKNDGAQPLSGRCQTMDDFYKELLMVDGSKYSEATFLEDMPGEAYEYSNVASSLGAHICEVVARSSGVIEAEGTFDDLVHKAILEPLGVPKDNGAYLCSSFSGSAAAEMPAAAIPSDSASGEFARDVGLYTFPDYPNGGMIITSKDYARMLGAVMGDGSFGGKRILKPETVELLRTVQFENEDAKQAVSYFYEHRFGRELLGHNGGEEGIATEAYFNPETGVGFVIFANEGWDEEDTVTEVFQAIEEEILETFEPHDYTVGLARGGEDEVYSEEDAEDEDEDEDFSDWSDSEYENSGPLTERQNKALQRSRTAKRARACREEERATMRKSCRKTNRSTKKKRGTRS
eukprot:TRINITY_DN9763_c0_g1_i1.p1 TRINITY_DN9763_c0_g1~~TRINITY_DN9763_c0_g1_i1.p1  ORF type:complete len:492 (+),score=108.72 TRINITY_DN9763_c0_g1_i1:52-1527(+)